ncbi:esterase [uncultured Castellaniella sp.]|uniref:esterase n=1 Tax=uncultured Castellaniella sp. TaxID=647907 RepID=UPI0026031DEC|nr:esterase [uncultured Castellaniella sp.]
MPNPPDSPDLRPDPLLILPSDGAPAQLFVVLHGESAEPGQMLELVAAIRQAFPLAVIVQPYGPFGAQADRRWIAECAPDAQAYVGLIADAGAALAGEVAAWQKLHGLSGEQTALVGFSEGAAVALEAVCSVPGLAGRALLFSTRFATLPETAPRTATLHLLHGAEDRVAPAGQARQVHAQLAELQGDVTLDIASNVGHELHEALIRQAIIRLQTCVPLRSWESAQGEPSLRIDEYSADDPQDGEDPGSGTLH